jgi:hypothetical protein
LSRAASYNMLYEAAHGSGFRAPSERLWMNRHLNYF